MARNKVARELEAISLVLDQNAGILDLVFRDLVQYQRTDTGRDGMTVEQVLRCAILKQYRDLTFEELAFHLEDSMAFRSFARLKMGRYPCGSALQENIKAIAAETWEAVNRMLLEHGAQQQVEQGGAVRLDSTVVETPIHHPTDSRLLMDGIRVITRLLQAGKDLNPTPWYTFADHQRAAKKRGLQILNARKDKVRHKAYGELLSLARRVLRGEQVPGGEKVVSFFECHTEVIVKGRRDTQYGHKIFLSGGRSGLILDCVIPRGNPTDAALFPDLLARQEAIYGRLPAKTAAGGAFASQGNLRLAQGRGVKDVMFAKKRGLRVLDMVKSLWVYKKLRNFRAGLEANISRLKRAFGVERCTWQGWPGFRQYVWSAVVSYNVLVLGMLLQAQ